MSKRLVKNEKNAVRSGYRPGARTLASAVVLVAVGCGSDHGTRESTVNSSATAPPGALGFTLLATGSISVDDRTQIAGGDVGASGEGAGSSPTVVIGSDAAVELSRVVVGQRVVLRDRARVGVVRADQVTAPFASFMSLSPFVSPPAVPAIHAVVPGSASVTVAAGQTSQLAAGQFGPIVVHGTLELTGGLYEIASLTLDNDAHLVARARSVVRIAQGFRALDRVHISVDAALGAGDLRFTVAGTNPGTTASVVLGNDNQATALVLASAGVTAGDRFVLTGVVAAHDVTIGHDGRLTFQAGFDCNADSTCADASVCTTDSCSDGQCANVPLPDGTACSDDNVCTLADQCQAGACVGNAQTCTTPEDCDRIGICAVTPVLNCVIAQADGTFVALFGYHNGADDAVPIDIGARNQFAPGAADRGQPNSFTPGDRGFWVSVEFDGTPLTWTLGGSAVTATKDSPACPPFPTGGDDDTEDSGDPTKAVPLPEADTPDSTLALKVASDNLFPLVTVPVVDHVEPAAGLAGMGPRPGLIDLGDGVTGLAAQASTRYTEVVLVNSTSQILTFVEGQFQGAAVSEPPSGIAPISYGHWQSKNGRALQGTGGHMTYSFAGSQITVNWDNPFIGSNSYHSQLSGPQATNFAVDRVGGGGNQATVFFILRSATTPATDCPFGTHQWAIDSLHSPQPPLSGFATAAAVILTPAKNITEVGKWQGTGCFVPRVVGRVVATAHSTDRFFTIDVILDEFDGAFLTDSGKAVRIEVAPGGTLGLATNPAHAAIVNDGLPALGSRIVFSGRLLIDHGSFLEVHPTDKIQAAKPCDQFGAGEALPLYCNQTLNDFFTWDSGQPPTPMGRADDRACFLTAMSGQFQAPQDEIHATIDGATNNWFLTGNAATSEQSFLLPGSFVTTPTPAEAAALLGIDVSSIVTVSPPAFGFVVVVVNVPHPLHAEARCVTSSSLSQEGTWNQGDSAVTVGTSDDACFLTRVAGHFQGGGESVQLFEDISNGGAAGTTVLSGKSQQAGVSASARCIENAQVIDFGFAWNQGDAATSMEFIDDFPACYLVAVGGHFQGRGEEVQIRADTFHGRVFWELGGLSQQQGVFAQAQCTKP